MKYSMFIGRWQPLHAGHLWLINERLKEGKNVCLAIRDVEPNENQPWTAQEIENMVHEGELKELIKDGRVITTIIPDIESINYGRGVGYDVIEHTPPTEIGDIGTLDTIILSGIITGSWETGLTIGGVEVITKMVLYFFHERAWYKFSKYGLSK